jgi:hypothetical protein
MVTQYLMSFDAQIIVWFGIPIILRDHCAVMCCAVCLACISFLHITSVQFPLPSKLNDIHFGGTVILVLSSVHYTRYVIRFNI